MSLTARVASVRRRVDRMTCPACGAGLAPRPGDTPSYADLIARLTPIERNERLPILRAIDARPPVAPAACPRCRRPATDDHFVLAATPDERLTIERIMSAALKRPRGRRI